MIELYYKAKWLSFNIQKLENNLLWDSLEIERQRPVYFFPLLVSNRLVNVEKLKASPLITFLELKELNSNAFSSIKIQREGEKEIKILGRTLRLIYFLYLP